MMKRLIDKDKLINQIKANTTITSQGQYEILKAIEQADELTIEELTTIKVGDVVRDTDKEMLKDIFDILHSETTKYKEEAE